MEDNERKVVKIVQELLLDDNEHFNITPKLISEKIDSVLRLNTKWACNLDRDVVINELIQRFSLWIGNSKTLINNQGHVAWLNSARKNDWRYWQRYREYLEEKLSYRVVDEFDDSTDSILELLEDPQRQGPWDRRGLVVGHVQSGKTASYTGLICKAADAGYKIIIVLAGLHNNLRSQTQIRLDEGFLGYETNSNSSFIQYVGVGKNGFDANIKPNCATNRSENGDFNTKVAKHLAISPEQKPWLFVVKKNKTVLVRLLEWIRNHAADTVEPSSGRKIVTNLPLLIIDDEADHASVDTGEQRIDGDGNFDENYQPKAINSNIRKILHSFTKSAYVGYTATPFANIFIHELGQTLEEGPDLFPSSFIQSLAAPSNYIGPAKVFGSLSEEGRDCGLPLVRIVDEEDSDDEWMPKKHKNGHIPLYFGIYTIPPSLVEAIDAFLLACAVRHLRGQGNQHSSMLVHVTRFNSVQKEVHLQIEEHMKNIRQRITRNLDHQTIIGRLKLLWETDYLPTSKNVLAKHIDQMDINPISWNEIEVVLPSIVGDIQVRAINGKAKEALDYSENEVNGLKIIAVGGDKLSRGLTLEGLTVSYFLRASKMYDTLMQMGRWFGYREGYLDLSRIYITQELEDWFGVITDAAEELREEFDLMVESKLTPREYGLKVRSHSVLMITSRLKMRSAKKLSLTFSGQILETISLFNDVNVLNHNLKITKDFFQDLNSPDEVNPTRIRESGKQQWSGTFFWKDVSSFKVINFFLSYQTHPGAYKVVSNCLAEFIQSMNQFGELNNWNVALIGADISAEGNEYSLTETIKTKMIKRQKKGKHNEKYSIGRLISPRDESIDLNDNEWFTST